MIREGKINGMWCMTHKVECCRCGYEFGYHHLPEKPEMKEFCVLCGVSLEPTEERLRASGNFCAHCGGRCEKVAKEIMTPDEADAELERIGLRN